MIMDFLPGVLLPSAFGPDTDIVLGKTHAALHNADSSQLNEDMIAEGFRGRQYSIEGKLDRLLRANEYLPWLEEIVFWLIENRPSECEYPSICHGDFHPINIMVKDGEIYFIDFQGGRIGPIQYDLASLLIDPYVELPHAVQAQLIDQCPTSPAFHHCDRRVGHPDHLCNRRKHIACVGFER